MPWKIFPVTLDGVTLKDANREPYFLRALNMNSVPPPSVVSVARIGASPVYIRTQPAEGRAFPIGFVLLVNTQPVVETLRDLFDPDDGTALLVVEDGDAVKKRVTVVKQGLFYNDGIWLGSLWAPDPTLLADVLSTSTITALADVAANFTATPDNKGETPTKPLFKIAPQAVQYATHGYAILHELAYAWRSELPATGPDSGTWLLEITDGGLNTAAIVKIASIIDLCSTTVSSVQAMPFDITLADTSGFDQEGICIALDVEEQFEYKVKNATELTLTARALGGTTNATHTASWSIQQSRMLKDGADIAVFVDGVKIPDEKVTLDDMNTAVTKIWFEIADAPKKVATVLNQLKAVDTVMDLREFDHGFFVGDYIVWVNAAAAVEQARISAVNGRQITITRPVRNGPAAGIVNPGDSIFRSGHHIQLVYNFSQATSRPINPDPPFIDTGPSTNVLWQWDAAPFYAEDNKRPGGWRRIKYPGSSAILVNRLSTKIGLDAPTAGQMRFHDVEPSASRPNFDAVEFVCACGTLLTNGLRHTSTVDWPFALQIIGRDFLGIDELVINRLGHESGNSHQPAKSYVLQNESFARSLQAIILRARNIIVTGTRVPSDSNVNDLEGALLTGTDAQSFVLDEDTPIDGIVERVRKETAGTKTFLVQLNERTGGGNVGPGVAAVLSHTLTSVTFLEVCHFFSSPVPILPAGSYFIVPHESSGGTGNIEIVRSDVSIYQRGDHYEFDGSVYVRQAAQDLWAHILSILADNQPEMVEASKRTSEKVDLQSALRIQFDTITPRTPLLGFRASEDAYYLDDTFSIPGQSFRIQFLDRWADLTAETITIDVAAKTIVHSKFGDSIRFALDPDSDKWLELSPGSTVVTVTPNEGTRDEDHTLEYRSAWQA